MGDGIEDGLSLQSAICPHLHQFSSQVAFCLRVLTLFRDKQLCCPCFLQRSIENCREDPSAAALNSVLSESSFLSSAGTFLEGMEFIIHSCHEQQCTQ